MFLAFLGCSSDSSDNDSPPKTVVKTKVTITRINVSTIPEKASSGFGWDLNSYPDIYLKAYDETEKLVGMTTYLKDYYLTFSNPVTTSFPNLFTTDLTNSILKVQVLDEDEHDTPSNSDDLIGEVDFYIHDYTVESNKYPEFVVKEQGGTIVTIYMTWE